MGNLKTHICRTILKRPHWLELFPGLLLPLGASARLMFFLFFLCRCSRDSPDYRSETCLLLTLVSVVLSYKPIDSSPLRKLPVLLPVTHPHVFPLCVPVLLMCASVPILHAFSPASVPSSLPAPILLPLTPICVSLLLRGVFHSFLFQEDDLNGIHIVAFAEKSDPGRIPSPHRSHPAPNLLSHWQELASHLSKPFP